MPSDRQQGEGREGKVGEVGVRLRGLLLILLLMAIKENIPLPSSDIGVIIARICLISPLDYEQILYFVAYLDDICIANGNLKLASNSKSGGANNLAPGASL